MDSLENKTILITGASTGIGLALVKTLLPTGATIFATARPESLDRFEHEQLSSSSRLFIRPLDVESYSQGSKLFEEIENTGGLDVLVNNAGISYRSVVEHMTPEDEETQMRVNYLGAMHLIRLALPKMREKQQGHIINISSVSGMMAMPTMGSYSASKFALEGATEALWYELRPWNIKVSLVQPGFVSSNAFYKVRRTPKSIDSNDSIDDPYHEYYENMESFVEHTFNRSQTNSEDVANKIKRLLLRNNPPLRVAATKDARFFYLLRRFLPRRIYHYILYRNLPAIRTWGPNGKNF